MHIFQVITVVVVVRDFFRPSSIKEDWNDAISNSLDDVTLLLELKDEFLSLGIEFHGNYR